MIEKEQLVALVQKYDPNANADALTRAYDFAEKMHTGQVRESGEPYYTHPVEVAEILIKMKLDTASIITALLHDTVEDTEATLDIIETKFGKEVAKLVDGVTKLTQIELQSLQTKQAENFRKLVLAMSTDIRVLVVKLADRLHNMRTISSVKSEDKRKRVARETMEIYAPLAGRIGIHHFKDELEDLSFSALNPDARESILTRLKFLREEDKDNIGEIVKDLKALFKENDLEVIIEGREKTPYSIWNKMRRKNVTFEQLSDIMAFRIFVHTIPECYQALGIIHSNYSLVPDRFKDFISTPKPNGYQSIHTAVLGPNHQRIEIQIRTKSMHETNEYGVAAHWKYKEEYKGKESKEYRWLKGLLDILDNASDPEEFLEHTKLEMFQDQVFCFTPKGDLITLPSGSTPIDFAYAVHSEVGNHCVGSKINGRMVPLRTILRNGDQVEITTSKSQAPSPTWTRYAITGKARAAIRRYIRSQKRNQFMELGKSMVHKRFKSEGIDFIEKHIVNVLPKLNQESIEDLYAAVGEGQISCAEVIKAVHPEHKHVEKAATPATESRKASQGQGLPLHGLIPGMAIHYAGCCHPIPGDKIVGIVQTGTGVTIHTFDCENLKQYEKEPDRWLDVDWDDKAKTVEKHTARLFITVFNRVGSIANLTNIIGRNHGNIMNFKIVNRSQTFFDILVDIEVDNVEHLNSIIGTLRSSSYINSVDRK